MNPLPSLSRSTSADFESSHRDGGLGAWLAALSESCDRAASGATTPIQFLQSTMPMFLDATGCATCGWIVQSPSGWSIDYWCVSESAGGAEDAPDTRPPDDDRLGEIASQLDDGGPVLHNDGLTVALRPPADADTDDEFGGLGGNANDATASPSMSPPSVAPQSMAPRSMLWFGLPTANDRLSSSGDRSTAAKDPDRSPALIAAATLMATLLRGHLERSREIIRGQRLRQILRAAAHWQTIDDLDHLLSAMADTATEVLDCRRASIFLHQKRSKNLIGRPAMGVEGGVLVVPDDRGIVGEVLRGGEGQLWTRGEDLSDRHNATIDRKTEFQTHSLAAVPMMRWRAIDGPRDRGGASEAADQLSQTKDCIGVFEAINARSGAFDRDDLQTLSELATHASVALATQSRRQTLIRTRDRLIDDAKSGSELIGQHPSIEHLRGQVRRIAPTDLSVLIRGENGTGKEILARQIHYQSDRHDKPFVAVNCAALVESLLESELFGHEKGSFTDASSTRIGKFEAAAGGTLFLDEIGDMTAGGQAKLLRALESREIVRVGGTTTIPVDVRIIAATNQPLEKRIVDRKFREDLFFRLAVVSLTLPPLRDRGDDILMLAEHFLRLYGPGAGHPQLSLSEAAGEALRQFSWPGNIRQLRNVIERTCYLTESDPIGVRDLDLPFVATDAAAATGGGQTELSEATRLFQVAHIERMIDHSRGNMTQAAERLGLHRSNLYRKMRQLGMPTSRDENAD